ncbi:MAG: ATP-binding protein [Spirochaetales bacterium]|nr:ATP-binding protein [Spirochaetales bacterium]
MSSKNKLSRKIDKAILQYELIEPGDRILLAISGGKDSLTLAYHLIHKQRGFPIPFELEAVHIQPDFPNGADDKSFLKLMEEWGLPCRVIQVPVKERLKPGRKMNCYWCSTQRRMELMKQAEELNCSKIALGHHMDDILETFLMNMAYKGEMSTMLPKLKYDNYPYTVIRPLAYVHEAEIVTFAEQMDFKKISCACNFDTTSKRHPARDAIDTLAINASVRDTMFKALSNPNMRYLMGGDGDKK